MDWDLPQLRTLAAVLDHGSFEAAATELQLTPSAVSQRLKALERKVGTILVQRCRPVRPTEAGLTVARLARQLAAAQSDAETALAEAGTLGVVRIAVNADSLATWFLPGVAEVADRVQLEVLREDQDRTADLLRDGTVMAAITSQRRAVQGCSVTALGRMDYRPMATAEFCRRWLPDPITATALRQAPVVVFDSSDRLQDDQLRAAGVDPSQPPRHSIPASTQYAQAVQLGLGWGMIPTPQHDPAAGLVDLAALPESPLRTTSVALYWQQWRLSTPALVEVAQAVAAAAKLHLRPGPAQ